MTPGGVRVRNVALPVIRRAYAVYNVDCVAAAAGVLTGRPGRR